jgi:hypothetical protein
MVVLRLHGTITQDGKLEVQLPEGLPTGEVDLTLEIQADNPTEVEEYQSWTEEELAELLVIEPLTGHEIVQAGLTGGWSDMGITDSVAWVEAQRRKRRKNLTW